MRVRMKVEVSGTLDGRPWPPRGGIVDLSDAVGAKLCAAGHAEPVADKNDVETTAGRQPTETRNDEPDNAVEPVQKRRGRPPGSKNKPAGAADETPDDS